MRIGSCDAGRSPEAWRAARSALTICPSRLKRSALTEQAL